MHSLDVVGREVVALSDPHGIAREGTRRRAFCYYRFVAFGEAPGSVVHQGFIIVEPAVIEVGGLLLKIVLIPFDFIPMYLDELIAVFTTMLVLKPSRMAYLVDDIP